MAKIPQNQQFFSNFEPGRKSLRIGVIGAGSSGLTALKALKDRGFSPICFEIGSDIGGLWVLKNKNGRGGAYRSLHINTSTTEMEFSDFPMRRDIGDFPSHTEMAAYFLAYAQKFDLLSAIHFNQEVVHCRPLSAEESVKDECTGYALTIRDRVTGSTTSTHLDALIVANGHHWSPAFSQPRPHNKYLGTILHATEYISPSEPHDLVGKRVLVVGMGNSAMDIAYELSRQGIADHVSVSVRRGAWVLPKYILGKPFDQGTFIPTWLPAQLRRRLVTASFRLLFGKMSDYGLPEPDHLIGEAHPTVSSRFPQAVKNGELAMQDKIASFSGKHVHFSNGIIHDFDAIIYCTGYNIKFPFFDEGHIEAPQNRLGLYFRAFHPMHRRVFFVGLAQTIGAIMPVAEAQSRAIAAHLDGEYALPTSDEMQEQIRRDEGEMAARFVPSPRHSMQVDPHVFHARLRKDMARGKKRARKGFGISFPVVPRKSHSQLS